MGSVLEPISSINCNFRRRANAIGAFVLISPVMLVSKMIYFVTGNKYFDVTPSAIRFEFMSMWHQQKKGK